MNKRSPHLFKNNKDLAKSRSSLSSALSNGNDSGNGHTNNKRNNYSKTGTNRRKQRRRNGSNTSITDIDRSLRSDYLTRTNIYLSPVSKTLAISESSAESECEFDDYDIESSSQSNRSYSGSESRYDSDFSIFSSSSSSSCSASLSLSSSRSSSSSSSLSSLSSEQIQQSSLYSSRSRLSPVAPISVNGSSFPRLSSSLYRRYQLNPTSSPIIGRYRSQYRKPPSAKYFVQLSQPKKTKRLSSQVSCLLSDTKECTFKPILCNGTINIFRSSNRFKSDIQKRLNQSVKKYIRNKKQLLKEALESNSFQTKSAMRPAEYRNQLNNQMLFLSRLEDDQMTRIRIRQEKSSKLSNEYTFNPIISNKSRLIMAKNKYNESFIDRVTEDIRKRNYNTSIACAESQYKNRSEKSSAMSNSSLTVYRPLPRQFLIRMLNDLSLRDKRWKYRCELLGLSKERVGQIILKSEKEDQKWRNTMDKERMSNNRLKQKQIHIPNEPHTDPTIKLNLSSHLSNRKTNKSSPGQMMTKLPIPHKGREIEGTNKKDKYSNQNIKTSKEKELYRKKKSNKYDLSFSSSSSSLSSLSSSSSSSSLSTSSSPLPSPPLSSSSTFSSPLSNESFPPHFIVQKGSKRWPRSLKKGFIFDTSNDIDYCSDTTTSTTIDS